MPSEWQQLFKDSVHSSSCHIIPKDAILCHLAFVVILHHKSRYLFFFLTAKHISLSFQSFVFFSFCSKLHTNKFQAQHIFFDCPQIPLVVVVSHLHALFLQFPSLWLLQMLNGHRLQKELCAPHAAAVTMESIMPLSLLCLKLVSFPFYPIPYSVHGSCIADAGCWSQNLASVMSAGANCQGLQYTRKQHIYINRKQWIYILVPGRELSAVPGATTHEKHHRTAC